MRYFVAVAEELSFRRAAERLQMAQPPLSRQIVRLEHEVGVRLLDRGPRGVALTSAGRALLVEARALLRRAREADDITRRAATGTISALRIGAIGSACTGWLPRVLPLFRARHPEVLLKVYEQQTGEQLESLKRGRVDVGFLRIRQEHPGLSRCVLGAEPLMAALPRSHALARRRVISIADLANEPFVFHGRHIGPDEFDAVIAACHESGFSPDIVHDAGHATTAALVAAGLGVSLVPSSKADLRSSTVAYRRVRPAARAAPMVAAVPTHDPHPQAHTLVELGVHVASQLV